MAIEFRDNGTISVDIGADTYTLRRPTMGQLWEFFELRQELSDFTQKLMEEKAQELAEADDADERAKQIAEELGDRRFAFRYMSEPWLRRAFEALGSSPLPDNLDDAPSELADPKLPSEILMFWRDVPLAHSPRRQ